MAPPDTYDFDFDDESTIAAAAKLSTPSDDGAVIDIASIDDWEESYLADRPGLESDPFIDSFSDDDLSLDAPVNLAPSGDWDELVGE
ncbi:hypothetical protein [Galbitalea soli]|uniref:Uncharacterized protein n=1 Tax=Galbitalea soli TaxID=1268042 RepID=A0A7C9TQX7_9MICO|nr:hypothetical protein [Galbitalea soli]NEM91002.1 hypothetical protein [Galbitalea soli]NYJ29689.1 hypothetical protein [Galbitalea soli]